MEWISVKDRVPNEKEKVLACFDDCIECAVLYSEKDGWWNFGGFNTRYVTHWMPLPEPPKAGD